MTQETTNDSFKPIVDITTSSTSKPEEKAFAPSQTELTESNETPSSKG